jgi:hypothetical protein
MAHKNKKPIKKEIKNYVDLLYMTPQVVNAKELAALFDDDKNISVQLWEEMNILELELPNENSVDFEPLSISFKDPSDAAFVKNRNIQTIYAINLLEDDLNASIPYFELIIEQYQGFICADSEDFNPVYAGTTKR